MLTGAVLLVAAAPASAILVGGSTARGPAMVQYNDSICVAWSGTDSQHHLNIACGDPNVGLTLEVTNQFSAFSPALAVYQGMLLMAWTGTDTKLNVAQVIPGSATNLTGHFTGNNGNTNVSSQGPALAVAPLLNGVELVIAWTGTDSHHHLNLAASFSPLAGNFQWSQTMTQNQLASGGPSIAAIGGTLYMGWTGTDGNHSLNLASNAISGGLQTGAAELININGVNLGSPNPPSLSGTGSLAYAWRMGGDTIELATDPQITPIQNRLIDNGAITTDNSPAIAPFNGALWVCWLDGNGQLEVAPAN